VNRKIRITPVNSTAIPTNNLRNPRRDALATVFAVMLSFATVLLLNLFPITYPLTLIQNLKIALITSNICAYSAWFSCSNLFDILFSLSLFLTLQLTGVVRVLHEGAHLTAAHWYFRQSHQIRARGIYVFVDYCPKSTWLRIALFPLVLPLAFFIVLVPFSPRFAIAFLFLTLLWSCMDFANIVLVYRSPGKTVRDIEEGLFVVD
jgi:hypothetical protein